MPKENAQRVACVPGLSQSPRCTGLRGLRLNTWGANLSAWAVAEGPPLMWSREGGGSVHSRRRTRKSRACEGAIASDMGAVRALGVAPRAARQRERTPGCHQAGRNHVIWVCCSPGGGGRRELHDTG